MGLKNMYDCHDHYNVTNVTDSSAMSLPDGGTGDLTILPYAKASVERVSLPVEASDRYRHRHLFDRSPNEHQHVDGRPFVAAAVQVQVQVHVPGV